MWSGLAACTSLAIVPAMLKFVMTDVSRFRVARAIHVINAVIA